MSKVLVENSRREYISGEVVEPGAYIDLDNGATILIREADELPEGNRVVQFQRRFRRIDEGARRQSAA